MTASSFWPGFILFVAICVVVPLPAVAEERAPASGSNPGTAGETERRTLLFADDHEVLYRPGTVRRLRPLDRHPANPLLIVDRPWETTIAYCSVYRDPADGSFQLWYQAWTGRSGCYLCYATSEDGLRWVKPSMGLVDFQGSTDNNILLRIGYGAGVLFDPRDPDPDRRYKAAFWEHNGTSVAFSPDGIHWRKHEGNPVIQGSHGDYIQPPFQGDPIIKSGRQGPPLSTSDVIDPQWDPARRSYMIYSKTWLDGPDGTMHWKRAVVRTDSDNFVHWTRPTLVVAPDEWDYPAGDSSLNRTAGGGGSGRKQIHSGPAFYYNGVYFSLLQVMDPDGTGDMPAELAVSRDGFRFSRPFRDTPFLPALPDKTKFDASVLWTNGTPIHFPDETRLILDADGYRVRGFSRDDAVPVRSDGLREPVRWTDRNLS